MTNCIQKKILILLTGGTISGNVAKNSSASQKNSSVDDFFNVLNSSLEIIKLNWNVEVHTDLIQLFNIDSSDMNPSHWVLLIEEIQKKYDSYDAFLVLHGTNTMGYTAAALSFAFENLNKPIILTGSQVPLGYLGSDAVTNLVNSIRLAVWGYHEIKGVIAVFGSKIITGVRVKKGTDFDYDPFSSFQLGTLGQIGRFIKINESSLEKHISYLSKSIPSAISAEALSVKKDFNLKDIISLTEFPGMQTGVFKYLVDNLGIKGFIFRAFGAGDPNKNLFPDFEYLKQKQIPIVITTQAPNGVSNFQVNENGQYLKEHDLAIPAYDMSIESMTVKLAWLMGQNFSYEEIKSKMLVDLHGEITIENELI